MHTPSVQITFSEEEESFLEKVKQLVKEKNFNDFYNQLQIYINNKSVTNIEPLISYLIKENPNNISEITNATIQAYTIQGKSLSDIELLVSDLIKENQDNVFKITNATIQASIVKNKSISEILEIYRYCIENVEENNKEELKSIFSIILSKYLTDTLIGVRTRDEEIENKLFDKYCRLYPNRGDKIERFDDIKLEDLSNLSNSYLEKRFNIRGVNSGYFCETFLKGIHDTMKTTNITNIEELYGNHLLFKNFKYYDLCHIKNSSDSKQNHPIEDFFKELGLKKEDFGKKSDNFTIVYCDYLKHGFVMVIDRSKSWKNAINPEKNNKIIKIIDSSHCILSERKKTLMPEAQKTIFNSCEYLNKNPYQKNGTCWINTASAFFTLLKMKKQQESLTINDIIKGFEIENDRLSDFERKIILHSIYNYFRFTEIGKKIEEGQAITSLEYEENLIVEKDLMKKVKEYLDKKSGLEKIEEKLNKKSNEYKKEINKKVKRARNIGKKFKERGETSKKQRKKLKRQTKTNKRLRRRAEEEKKKVKDEINKLQNLSEQCEFLKRAEKARKDLDSKETDQINTTVQTHITQSKSITDIKSLILNLIKEHPYYISEIVDVTIKTYYNIKGESVTDNDIKLLISDLINKDTEYTYIIQIIYAIIQVYITENNDIEPLISYLIEKNSNYTPYIIQIVCTTIQTCIKQGKSDDNIKQLVSNLIAENLKHAFNIAGATILACIKQGKSDDSIKQLVLYLIEKNPEHAFDIAGATILACFAMNIVISEILEIYRYCIENVEKNNKEELKSIFSIILSKYLADTLIGSKTRDKKIENELCYLYPNRDDKTECFDNIKLEDLSNLSNSYLEKRFDIEGVDGAYFDGIALKGFCDTMKTTNITNIEELYGNHLLFKNFKCYSLYHIKNSPDSKQNHPIEDFFKELGLNEEDFNKGTDGDNFTIVYCSYLEHGFVMVIDRSKSWENAINPGKNNEIIKIIDSSHYILSEKAKGLMPEAQKTIFDSCEYLNKNHYQKNGTCWIHAASAFFTLLKMKKEQESLTINNIIEGFKIENDGLSDFERKIILHSIYNYFRFTEIGKKIEEGQDVTDLKYEKDLITIITSITNIKEYVNHYKKYEKLKEKLKIQKQIKGKHKGKIYKKDKKDLKEIEKYFKKNKILLDEYNFLNKTINAINSINYEEHYLTNLIN